MICNSLKQNSHSLRTVHNYLSLFFLSFLYGKCDYCDYYYDYYCDYYF